ncbi:MAG: prepilin peptidase [Firmicutes bacterium]|nr:prepilin peptidase [Bacillota bacterium]
MEGVLNIIIISMAAAFTGLMLGLSAVYVFNHMPAKWLCDYDEEPSEELLDRSRKRMKEYPAKFVFPAAFSIAGVYLCNQDYVFGFAALFELWLLLMISLSDSKYMIIPDQFVIFLALFAFPMSVYRSDVEDMVFGALLGAGIMLLVSIIGKLMTKKSALGFGDVKLMAAIGLTAGVNGTAFVLLLTSLTSAAYFAVGLVRGIIKKHDEKPLGPFIALSMAAYLILTTLYL